MGIRPRIEDFPISQEIYLDIFVPEYLVGVRPEASVSAKPTDQYSPEPLFVLVYKYDRTLRRSCYQYVYVFCGARLA